jgi:hypothetical protein
LGQVAKPDALRADSPRKVLEKLATSDKVTIVVERQSAAKMRVTSGSWDGEKVILRDQVLEVHNVEGGCTSRESLCTTDKGNPQIEPYGPMESVH